MYSEQYSSDEYMKMPYEYMKIPYEFTLEAWQETPIDNCSFIITPKSLSIGSMSKIENGNKKNAQILYIPNLEQRPYSLARNFTCLS